MSFIDPIFPQTHSFCVNITTAHLAMRDICAVLAYFLAFTSDQSQACAFVSHLLDLSYPPHVHPVVYGKHNASWTIKVETWTKRQFSAEKSVIVIQYPYKLKGKCIGVQIEKHRSIKLTCFACLQL